MGSDLSIEKLTIALDVLGANNWNANSDQYPIAVELIADILEEHGLDYILENKVILKRMICSNEIFTNHVVLD